MTVKELIAILQSKPQDLQIVYRCCSEFVLLEANDIDIMALCLPRNDGWVANKRPDKPKQDYLTFPGN